jgi:hypothetical protein
MLGRFLIASWSTCCVVIASRRSIDRTQTEDKRQAVLHSRSCRRRRARKGRASSPS